MENGSQFALRMFMLGFAGLRMDSAPADIILVSLDGYLREQDWEQLLTYDVMQAGDTIALLFGPHMPCCLPQR